MALYDSCGIITMKITILRPCANFHDALHTQLGKTFIGSIPPRPPLLLSSPVSVASRNTLTLNTSVELLCHPDYHREPFLILVSVMIVENLVNVSIA